ncbi:MAG: FAD-dependent oxidoreductase [Solirubrobacteraceae bacterium]
MITQAPERWDDVVDVVVVGSGAAGLSAAVTAHDAGAEVLVLEKADMLGGTAGVSGGILWVPNNHHMQAAGIADSREDALAYIRRLTHGREPDPQLIEVYVDRSPEAIASLEAATPLELGISAPFTDYHAQYEGGRPEGGRSLEPLPYDARSELGDLAPKVRTSPHMFRLTMEEGAKSLFGEEVPMDVAAKRVEDDVRVIGAALVAPLVKGLVDRGVELRTGAAVAELVMVDGEVAGVRVEQDGHSVLVGARRGVVLAAGGFEWNAEMVHAFVGRPLAPMSPPHNEGDAIRMVLELGGRVANMNSYWGQPCIVDPTVEFEGHTLTQMASVRCMPGVVVVNSRGERFVNEACCYQDFPKTIDQYDPVAMEFPNERHFMVWDQRIKDAAMFLPTILPGEEAPDFVLRGETIAELAEQMGVDPGRLTATIERWNQHVVDGEDPDFGRGTTWFEGYQTGGPDPQACLQPVKDGPFYALPMVHGALGTNGGPLVDGDARVQRWDGTPVAGLYAAGNTTASVFGQTYPGGGATLGPALTFGYLAGKHAAGRPARDIAEAQAGVAV